MNIKKTTAIAALAGIIALTGCSTSTDEPSGGAEAPSVESASPETTAATAAPAETSAPADTPEKSERGNLIKNIGDGASFSNNGVELASFVVNSITADPQCTGQFAMAPENGHFIAVNVSLATTPELANEMFPMFDLNPYNMKIVAENGTTSNANLATGASYMCLNEVEVLPNSVGPAENVTGTILLDSEVAAGTLIITTGPMTNGWEYKF